LKITHKEPKASAARLSFDKDDPSLDLNGRLVTIWAVQHANGYYYWSWTKFEAWVAYNWKHLNRVQQIAVTTLRAIYKNPQVWRSKHPKVTTWSRDAVAATRIMARLGVCPLPTLIISLFISVWQRFFLPPRPAETWESPWTRWRQEHHRFGRHSF
jgi:hypothetical protein